MACTCGSIPGSLVSSLRGVSAASSPKVTVVAGSVAREKPTLLDGAASRRLSASSSSLHRQSHRFLSGYSAGSLCCSSESRWQMMGSFFGHSNSQPFDDEEYIEARVINAVRMVPNRGALMMTMENGVEVEVEHVHPSAGRLLYQSSTPTIFLKMVDNSDLLLPIVVGELAINLLLKAFNKDKGARPNYYDLMHNMVEVLHYEVKMVKITQRVVDTYFSRIYLGKPGESEMVSVDARPSDAINLAVRSQVPIFVSKSIVRNDAVRILMDPSRTNGIFPPLTKHSTLDRPTTTADDATEEIALMKSMMEAAEEERYADAAAIRDKINMLRNKNKRQLNKF